eukprot:EG_transcript_17106
MNFLICAIASCVAEVVTLPLDTIKVRIQVQTNAPHDHPFRGLSDAFARTYREEGPAGLFRGLKPALLRQSTYGSVRLALYDPLKSLLSAGSCTSFACNVAAGMLSGAVAAGVFNPTDLVKVRMQSDPDGGRYRSLLGAFRQIVELEGVRGLYKGVFPTVQRAAIVSAAELCTYDLFETLCLAYLSLESPLLVHLLAALCAGLVATVVSSPADVIKSRLMSQPIALNGKGLYYRGSWDCLRQTTAAEGYGALWRGFWPNYLRLGPYAIVMFLVLEQLKQLVAGL